MDNKVQKGRIELIIGPMSSGKSTELLRRVRRYIAAKKTCIVFKHVLDRQRHNTDDLMTHDKQTITAHVYDSLKSIPKEYIDPYDILAVDEAQFFGDVVEFAEKMANKGKIVLLAGLDGSFERGNIGNLLQLIPKAEGCHKLTAICTYCGDEASFTLRKGESKDLFEAGGLDTYAAVCRSCHQQYSK